MVGVNEAGGGIRRVAWVTHSPALRPSIICLPGVLSNDFIFFVGSRVGRILM